MVYLDKIKVPFDFRIITYQSYKQITNERSKQLWIILINYLVQQMSLVDKEFRIDSRILLMRPVNEWENFIQKIFVRSFEIK